MQLTKEQRIFIVMEYETTKNCEQVRRAFNETFPERNLPDKKTVYRTIRKFNEHESISNRYKGNSGRKIIQRTENNIAIVQRAITEVVIQPIFKNYNYSKRKQNYYIRPGGGPIALQGLPLARGCRVTLLEFRYGSSCCCCNHRHSSSGSNVDHLNLPVAIPLHASTSSRTKPDSVSSATVLE
ncbi:Protein of unknown function DUF4817 [Trinorchestia longiramus]|nr:Protein of unknown function DUF4817 [Trinorchestia longiramus]